MAHSKKTLGTVVIAACLAWHVLAVLAPAWVTVGVKPSWGRDFKTYFYAMDVAWEGEDPYDKKALAENARADDVPGGTHPFLYPPPFLLIMLWSVPLDLQAAYRMWFWLDELWLAATVIALWRWWRPIGPSVGVSLALAVAVFTAIPANHVMGQANFPGLALAMLGLWADARGRKVTGGVLMGAACMVKMSPALFVAWWLVKGNWRAAGTACVTAVVLSLAVLPILSWEHQLGFYTDVLPTFGSGRYNGLTVRDGIGLFGNHSIPNLYHQLFLERPRELSSTARALSTVTMLGLVGGLGWLFRRRDDDDLQRACQVGAIGIALLLIPVYTYEHHAVWAIPAVVASTVALVKGRLGRVWAVPLGIAIAVWATDIGDMKALSLGARPISAGVALLLQESKFLALGVLLAATARGATRRYDASVTGETHERVDISG
jgi:alpha-1,2-mannosyltransferase